MRKHPKEADKAEIRAALAHAYATGRGIKLATKVEGFFPYHGCVIDLDDDKVVMSYYDYDEIVEINDIINIA